jgi:hypothetical protein
MEYLITSTKWHGDIRAKYYSNGYLEYISIPEVFDADSMAWFSTHFPVHIEMLFWIANNTGAKVTEVTSDVDFITFWELYNKKIGSKEHARQYWEGEKRTINKRPISEGDRLCIMKIMPRFIARYKGEKKQYQPIATSFLHQRLWDAEAETLPIPKKSAAIERLLENWKVKTK